MLFFAVLCLANEVVYNAFLYSAMAGCWVLLVSVLTVVVGHTYESQYSQPDCLKTPFR